MLSSEHHNVRPDLEKSKLRAIKVEGNQPYIVHNRPNSISIDRSRLITLAASPLFVVGTTKNPSNLSEKENIHCNTHQIAPNCSKLSSIVLNRSKLIQSDRNRSATLPQPLFNARMTQKLAKMIVNRVGLEPTHLSILASDDNDAEALLNHLKLAP